MASIVVAEHVQKSRIGQEYRDKPRPIFNDDEILFIYVIIKWILKLDFGQVNIIDCLICSLVYGAKYFRIRTLD